MKVEQAIKRSQTFDVRTVPQHHQESFQQDYDYEYGQGQIHHARQDDAMSIASSHRSHGTSRTKTTRRSQSQSRPALTMGNLKTHSEVSSVAPSRPPGAYRAPYAETSRDMAVSRPSLAQSRSYAPSSRGGNPADHHNELQQYSPQRMAMQRSHTDSAIGDGRIARKKSIDMDLAYGDLPPDLAHRVDLDPAYHPVEKEDTAQALIQKVESMLVEADCLHHTAQHTIKHLQENPEAAAAVALTLAELSALVGKMSPAFLGVLKGGSPAIFALLASPQFMIAAGVAVGMTVVMFGGWKIVKKVKEAQQPALPAPPMTYEAQQYPVRAPYPISEQQYDEALVIEEDEDLEEELSTIESWRRGISPGGENECADTELISPEADRAIRSEYGDDDARTVRSFRTFRSSRTAKTSKTDKTEKTSKSTKTTKTSSSRRDADVDVPERKSSKLSKEIDAVSEAGSTRSHRSSRSEKTDRSAKTTRSKRTLAIEEGGKEKDNTIETVLRPKKDNMLKNMFKKKADVTREKVHSVASVKA